MIFKPLVIQYSNYFTEFKKSIKNYYGLTSLRNLMFIKPDKRLYYQDNLETEFCISHPDWSQVQDPPAEFPPEEHTHNYADPAHTHNYADPAHTHNYADPAHTHNYADPAHTHNYADPGHFHDDRYYTETEINTILRRIVGEIIMWATDSAPSGWLLCAGQEVSRSTYLQLYAILGNRFGAGNGSTTFNLPDLRGRVPLGQDDMGGSSANRVTAAAADSVGGSGGAETHTLTAAELAAHNHGVYISGGAGTGFVAQVLSNQIKILDGSFSSSQGGGSPHNNLQPYLTLNFIIFAGA